MNNHYSFSRKQFSSSNNSTSSSSGFDRQQYSRFTGSDYNSGNGSSTGANGNAGANNPNSSSNNNINSNSANNNNNNNNNNSGFSTSGSTSHNSSSISGIIGNNSTASNSGLSGSNAQQQSSSSSSRGYYRGNTKKPISSSHRSDRSSPPAGYGKYQSTSQQQTSQQQSSLQLQNQQSSQSQYGSGGGGGGGAEWDTNMKDQDSNYTSDPRTFFEQKPTAEESERDANGSQMYLAAKYRRMLDRENLKRHIEEDIVKSNAQLNGVNLNHLIKVRLVFSQLATKNEDIYQLDEQDLKRFFGVFGKIEKIVVKDKCTSYISFSDIVASFAAQRAMNQFPLDDIQAKLEIQLCVEDPEEVNENKLIGHFMHETIKDEDFIFRDEKNLRISMNKFKYTNVFAMEVNDPDFHLKERIMGASASNFFRLFYLCEKNSVETGLVRQDGEQPQQQSLNERHNEESSGNSNVEEITFRMIVNGLRGTENEVAILANNLDKYNTAVRYLHELLCQVNEEYRRFCEFQKKSNPGALHIKRIEKFNIEPELTFISSKPTSGSSASTAGGHTASAIGQMAAVDLTSTLKFLS